MFIDGIAIAGYRSFGELQHIGPFKKINIIIGSNNSGKSNILDFLHNVFPKLAEGRARSIADFDETIDQPKRSGNSQFAIGIAKNSNRIKEEFANKQLKHHQALDTFLTSSELSLGSDYVWFYRSADWQSKKLVEIPTDLAAKIERESLITSYLYGLLAKDLSSSEGRTTLDNIRLILNALNTFRPPIPKISLIPAFRRVGDSQSDYKDDDLSGKGIIKQLHNLQNPTIEEIDLKKQFRKINRFLREVTGDESARIEIPFNRAMILVEMEGITLPLDSLGTGIHEVILLASAATVKNDQVICMEEPEIHLHPNLQRKLLKYLSENTTNQYFISTHSAHILDTKGAAVFHVRLEGGESVVTSAESPSEKFNICSDLGYRASDIMQSNCIIWVEGPSDRIYLNHWIKAEDEDLNEGLNYSIMFYGGRLLSHLSGLDPKTSKEVGTEVEDFISLRILNRNSVILMDSDKKKPRERINSTKRRVRDHFNDEGEPGFAWITDGREIENYIPTKLLQECVDELHPDSKLKVVSGKFRNALPIVNPRAKNKRRVDKVQVSRKVVEHPADLREFDLKKQIDKLVEFIKHSNEGKGEH